MRKSWYDPNAPMLATTAELRAAETHRIRRRRDRPGSGLGSCLLYPLIDGPGVALMVFMPPALFLLTLPVFDWIAAIDPFRRGDWKLGLLMLPIFLPMLASFAMTFGYCLLVVGQMLVSSALGENEHPSWPEWNTDRITEGIGRWIWASFFGLAFAGFPIVLYWIYCGNIDWFDLMVFGDLVILSAGYAQMALAASLLHDSLIMANPITVIIAIARIGWDYVQPCLLAGVAVAIAAGAFWAILFHMPSMRVALVALWGFWVLVLYEAMVVVRMLGLTYYAHSDALLWFRQRPYWASSRFGHIYSNG